MNRVARKAGGMIWTLFGIAIGTFVFVVGGWRVVSRRWLAHEARKAEEARRTLDRVMQASHTPAAAGWPHRRIS